MRIFSSFTLNPQEHLKIAAVLFSALALLLLGSLGALASPPRNESASIVPVVPDEVNALEYMPGQVIVKFREGTSALQLTQISLAAGVESILHKITPLEAGEVYVMKLAPETSVESAVEKLRSSPQVAYADPNYVYELSDTPNDPGFTNQYAYNNTGQTIKGVPGTPDADIDAVEAWDLDQGSTNPVAVAVLDTGIDLHHPDLENKLWTNADEIPGNRVDDDSNGYIDDVNGYNMFGIMLPIATSEEYFGNLASTQVYAQSIRGTGADLTHTGPALRKAGNPTEGITVSVRDDLSGPDLAFYTIAPEDVPSSSLYGFYEELSSPVSLSDGTDYYLIFQTNQLDPSNYYYIADFTYYNGAYYAEGSEWAWNGSTWINYAEYDLSFITNPNPVPHDDFGHGTHCSGIVGAQTDNSIGVAGTSPGARIMHLKVGSTVGVLVANAIEGMYYAADNGADAISMSFGGSGTISAVQDAVNYAFSKGVTLFAAVGNMGSSGINYPAGCTHVIGVGATDNTDTIASFSTYNSSVDVSAPGVAIYSTTTTYDTPMSLIMGYAKNYDFVSGTSMACPTAAGVAALVISRSPSLSPGQIEQVLEESADDKGAAGRDDYYGYGRINAFNALSTEPSALTVTSVSPAQVMQFLFIVNISVKGTGFLPGATLRLEKGGSVLGAFNVKVVSDSNITGSVWIFGATTGAYDVVVVNPDSQEARFSKGFTVTSPCGAGSGAALIMLGITLGLLSLAGSGGILKSRRRRKRSL